MRRLFIVLIATTAAWSCEAAQDAAGRWSGRAQIPGRDVPLVIDLAKDPAGAWIGSMIMPGLDVKGAPLENIHVGESDVAFDTGDTFGAPPDGSAAFAARLDGRGEIFSVGTYSPAPPRNSTLANFFNPLVNHMERMFLTGKATYPVERTRLTTGLTAAGVESLHRGQTRYETPHLAVRYQATKEPTFWRT
jgi:hypothetical protein